MRRMLVLLLFPSLAGSQTTSTTHRFPQTLADWQTLLPTVEKALQIPFGKQALEGPYGVGIYRVADITGDQISEALVSFGVPGASTTQLTLVRIQNGKPVVARIQNRKGKTAAMTFVEGASVMHTDRVDLLPKEHAFYLVHYEFTSGGPDEGQKVRECGGEAYRWNSARAIFHYAPTLTDKLTQDLCRKLRDEWK